MTDLMGGTEHGNRAVLTITNLAKSYGKGPVVLSDVSLSMRPGEFLGVIGPNGSGKTTLFGLIAGQLSANSGSIALDGEDVTRLSGAQRACKGIGRTFQVPQAFANMTVFENLLVGASFAAGLERKQASDLSCDILQKTGFSGRERVKAGSLTLLDRKRLELA
jgi:branched-chain amino acid transport system ATP-binding protein